MIKRLFVLIALITAFSITASFAQMQESRLELDYGTSHKLQKYGQILNPDADKNLKPVEGLDGEASKETMKSYRESFKAAEGKHDFQLSTGGESK